MRRGARSSRPSENEDAGSGALLGLDGLDELVRDVILPALLVRSLAGADKHGASGREGEIKISKTQDVVALMA